MSTLAEAQKLHLSGRAAEAEAAYRALLAAAPEAPEVLHALGVLLHQRGDSAQAVTLLARAAAAQPKRAEPRFHLGLALMRAGDATGAARAFGEAVALAPAWPEAHYDRANALRRTGAREAAARSYRQALRLKPDFLQAQVNLAQLLAEMGKPDQAEAGYRRALRQHPDRAEVHAALGALLAAQGRAAEAEASLRAALALRPDFPAVRDRLLALLGAADRHAEAVVLLREASALHPDDAALAERLGKAAQAAEKLDVAEAAFARAVAREPGRLASRVGLAEVRRARKNFAGAEAVLRPLAADHPDHWLPVHDLGNVLRDQGRFAEAEACYRAALAIADLPLIRCHLGAVLRDLNRLDEAQAYLAEACAADPANEAAHYNLCIARLTAGRLAEGFAAYDTRFGKYKPVRMDTPRWGGEDIAGQTLLVSAEQGLGDTIQFARYVPALRARGARVIFRVQDTLKALLATLSEAPAVVGRGEPMPLHDVHVHLMSLPHLLGLAETPAPLPIPYLRPDPARTAMWRDRLRGVPGLRVGLAWAGNPNFPADHLRSLPEGMLPALACAGVSFVSLQKDRPSPPGLVALDAAPALADLGEAAALVAALDLLVGVDSALVHLAGALGRPVWLLNRFDTCWRWQCGTAHSIWYPTLRQFRQETPGDWSAPVARLRAALAPMAEAHKRA